MKPFEEIREAMARALWRRRAGAEYPGPQGSMPKYLSQEVDPVLAALAAHGIDVRRIAAGELKVVGRLFTDAMQDAGWSAQEEGKTAGHIWRAEMVTAATETEGVKEVDNIVRTHAITGRGKLTYHLKGMPPPIIQAWHAMWDASK